MFPKNIHDQVPSLGKAGTQPEEIWLIVLFYKEHNGIILFYKEM